jgi:hypothetical protein
MASSRRSRVHGRLRHFVRRVLADFWHAHRQSRDRGEWANSEARDALEKVATLGTSFSTYREQVAKDFIHRIAMREVEDRLTAAIDRLGDRLDRFIEAAVHR